MQKRKIIHIIPSLSKGGAERFVVDLCNELAAYDKYEIHIISLQDNAPENTFMSELGSNVIYHCLNKKSGFDLPTLIKLTQFLLKESPFIIHTHINALEYSFLYKLVSGNKSQSYHTIHNDAFKECNIPLIRKLRRFLYKKSIVKPVTISYSSSSSFKDCYHLFNDTMIENGRVPLKKVKTYNDINLFPVSTENAFVIVNIARITRAKNQSLLIDAIDSYNANHKKKCFLAIVGSIVEPEYYEKLKIKQNKYIFFTGPRSDIAEILSTADAFALSSVYEGMPISLIEAFSVGCIPICTPVGGITEMISHGKTGFLSDDLTLKSYRKAIVECLETVDRTKIQEACMKEFNNKYHIAISGKKYIDLYEK